jgi:hypothetical protein
MSIRLLTEIWENGPNSQADTLVLLALADFANDRGECWPSITSICKKSRLSNRGVQKVLARLKADGWLEIRAGGGRHQCNFYTIKTPNRSVKTPNEVHPLGTENPEPECINPEPECTNPEPRSPKPLRTIKEPSEKNSNARDPILETLCAVHGVTDEAAKIFIRHRKILRKPLSPIAADRLAKTLWEIVHSDGDASDALGMAEEKGWQSIQPNWYFNAKGKSHANRNQITISNGCGNGPADARPNLLRLAGVGETSGLGGQ